MITVDVLELFLKSAELLSDGYEKVELTELDGDDEFASSLAFSAVVEDDERIDFEELTDCSDDESFSISFSHDSIAPYTVTFDDLMLMSHAFRNAIDNCETSLDDKFISAERRSEIASSLKKFTEYLNHIDHFLHRFIRG